MGGEGGRKEGRREVEKKGKGEYVIDVVSLKFNITIERVIYYNRRVSWG